MYSVVYILVFFFFKFFILIIPILVSVAYMTLIERKIIGELQRRKGPSIVGVLGLLQPFSDALKLLFKEGIIPYNSNNIIFLLAPIITLTISLTLWSIVPFDFFVVVSDINIGVFFLFAVSSLNVYGIIVAGWSSNSKYAFLGSLRSAAQMISFEVSMGLILIPVIMYMKTLNLSEIVIGQKNLWNVYFFFPLFILMFISTLAETNRAPFDLPEAEAELVAGFNVEYSSMGFALFFLGEYSNILLMSLFIIILFFGGWGGFFFFIPNWFNFGFKVIVFLYLFVAIRASYPRYRYDQLMKLCWKVFLPLSLGFVWFYGGIIIGFFYSSDLDTNLFYCI